MAQWKRTRLLIWGFWVRVPAGLRSFFNIGYNYLYNKLKLLGTKEGFDINQGFWRCNKVRHYTFLNNINNRKDTELLKAIEFHYYSKSYTDKKEENKDDNKGIKNKIN